MDTNPLNDIRNMMEFLNSVPITRYICTEMLPDDGIFVQHKNVKQNTITYYFHPGSYGRVHQAMVVAELGVAAQTSVPISPLSRTPEADKISDAFLRWQGLNEAPNDPRAPGGIGYDGGPGPGPGE